MGLPAEIILLDFMLQILFIIQIILMDMNSLFRYLAKYKRFSMRRILSLVRFVLPRHEKEGRTYVTIAVGCTGGRHRSVYVAERLGSLLEREGSQVEVHHRDREAWRY